MLEADDNQNSDQKRINTNVIQMDDIDFELLKSSILFKHWDDVTFREFIDDRKIFLQRFK
jgi:hypothetical protein